MSVTDAVRVEGRFVRSGGEDLATLVFRPPNGVRLRCTVLHVPAAFEEMNKSRRTVALQARAFAKLGILTVVYDAAGTGDSSGDHGDATWDIWRRNASDMFAWLATAERAPVCVWGLRLGGLLATGLVSNGTLDARALILWQPVFSGSAYVNQFLRLAATQDVAANSGARSEAPTVKAELAAGRSVDVAGYALHPDLVRGAAACTLQAQSPPVCAVVWRECSPVPAELSPMAAKLAASWRNAGTRVDAECIGGPSFWAAMEIEEAHALIASTTQAVMREVDRVEARAL